jgi:replicative DNA helicase
MYYNEANMRDIEILAFFLSRENYNKYREIVRPEVFAKETGIILQDMDSYYQDHKEIDLNKFQTWFHHFRHPDLKLEYRDMYDRLFAALKTISPAEDVLLEFNKKLLASQLSEAIENNKEPAIFQDLIEKYNSNTKIAFEDPWLSASLDTVLESTDRSKGLKWRLPQLQDHLEGLCLGDFIVIAGRPNNGKTTFLSSEITNIVQQIPEDKIILWINNEGVASQIKIRLYCSMFAKKREEIYQNKEKAEELFKKKGGDKIKLVDFHGKGRKELSVLLQRYKPALLVIDMLDHLKGFDYISKNEASDEKYDRLYQWLREVASTVCPVIGTSQVNFEGINKEYPSMEDLKGSSTAKQGGATTIITIGSKDKLGFENTRFIGTTKNKVGKLPLRLQVTIDMERGRYNA